MVPGVTLLLATLATAPSVAPVSERPVCVADEALDEAAAIALPDEQALTPSPAIALRDAEDCASPAASPPTVVNCNDRRHSVWVREMIGSCAMPRLAAQATFRAPREPRSGCSGGPARAPAPLRAAARSSDRSPSLLSSRVVLPPPLLARSPLARALPLPRSIHGEPLERPPRA